MIKKVHHACIAVSNIEEAVAFYRDTLGLKMTMDFEISGEELDALLGVKSAHLRMAYFDEGLEIAYYYSPIDGKPLNARPWDFGFTFLILEVDDLDKTYAELVKKGVKFSAPPPLGKTEIPTEGKVRAVHLHAPDNVRMSLIELPKK